MRVLREHIFDSDHRLRMSQGMVTFYEKAPVDLIEITYEKRDLDVSTEELAAGGSGWARLKAEYYHAKDRAMADRAFDEHATSGGFKENSIAIPMFLDTLPNKGDL